jgi:hypothetical protein
MAPRAADIGPACLVECVLEVDTIAFAIAQDYYPGPRHAQLVHLLDQSNMEVLGKWPFLPARTTHASGWALPL